jgi:SAM-dependent methyltransferase
MGYQAPFAAADLLHLNLGMPSARILDAGCSTGLVGEELFRLGYRNLVGLDYSADMLERANQLTEMMEDRHMPCIEEEGSSCHVCVMKVSWRLADVSSSSKDRCAQLFKLNAPVARRSG